MSGKFVFTKFLVRFIINPTFYWSILMFYKKILTIFIFLAFAGQIFAQTVVVKSVKKTDITPELQEKSFVLLNNLAREAEQFTLPLNRITARLGIADLLWEKDEKQVRILFQNAISDLSALIDQIPPENVDASDEVISERYITVNDARLLRSELLLSIAPRDPKLALEILQTMNRKDASGANLFEDDKTLELDLAAQITLKDPKQAYEIAKKNLDEGIASNLFSTLEDIYKKDAELGAKLAQDIVAKIKTADTKINASNSAPGNSMSNIMSSNGMSSNTMKNPVDSGGFTITSWELQTFLETIKKLEREAAKNKKSLILSENSYKEVIEVLAQVYLKQPYLLSYELAKTIMEIAKYFPAKAQALRSKIGQQETATLDTLVITEKFQAETEGKSVDEVVQIIEKKTAAERDDLYWKAAEKAFSEGNIENAKKFHKKIKSKREYDYLEKAIENALPLKLAEKGDLTEVRQQMVKLKTNEERIAVLTALAISVAGNNDKKTATALLEEARSIYSGRMKNRRNLTTVLHLTQAYAVFDAEQSFAFLENNISYFNEIINAAIILDEFNESGSTQNDELRIDTIRNQAYQNVPKGVMLIKNLATADFDRMVNFAERFSRAEIRFFARYRILESLLNPEAEQDEQKFKTTYENEHHEH
jgi:Flp pilus assembly protein TadD